MMGGERDRMSNQEFMDIPLLRVTCEREGGREEGSERGVAKGREEGTQRAYGLDGSGGENPFDVGESWKSLETLGKGVPSCDQREGQR